MSIRFDGRVAIVTGAGGGLGREHALALAARGAKVVVNDLGGAVDGTGGSGSAAQNVVDEIKAAGGEAVADAHSVSDEKGAAALVQRAVDSFGTVDILINNAGILRDKSFSKMDMADFRAVVDVHLLGSAYVTKACWPIMTGKNYGRIVMTTSTTGLFGNFGQANYGAAKLGLVGLMNNLKIEGQKTNVKVNTICPVAATRMTEGLMPADFMERLRPGLVTPAVLFLAAEDAPTGEIIEAGAGWYARVQIYQANGVHLGNDVNVDDIAKNWDRISDMSGARAFATGSESFVGGINNKG